MQVEVKLEGLGDVMTLLRSLPEEVASKRGGPVRTALRKGALVIQKQAKENLQRVTNNATEEDKRLTTGLLIANLVVTRGKPPAGVNGEVFLVRVRRKKYTLRSDKKTITTQRTGSHLEYGTSKQPAEPWLRPALNTRGKLAIETVEIELKRAVDRAIKKLSKGKGGLT